MNYNIITYCIYFFVLLFIVLYVGTILFKNGRSFLINTFSGNEITADSVNKFLLSGYYLVNIGYTIIAMKIWDKVNSLIEMINILSGKIGIIILILGFMHVINVMILVTIGKNKTTEIINK